MKIAVPASPWNRSDLFTDAGFEVLEGHTRSPDELVDLLRDADGAQVGVMPLTTREVLEASPRLKVVSRMGVGVDSIDLDAATELGILVTNVPGVNTVEVAEHAMAMLLATTRCVVDATNSTKAGKWADDPRANFRFYGAVRNVAAHTVGIVGFGSIGRAFAVRVRGFGPRRIIACDPYVDQVTADAYGVQMVPFETLLADADYVSIHCSLTAETRHMFDAAALARMREGAVLVNTARGPIVDGGALADALQSGPLAAAALDVTEAEPIDSQDALLGQSNLILSPHIAGFSPSFLTVCPIRQAENIINVLTGKPPHGLANPEVIKTIALMRATDPGRWAGVPDFSTALAL